MIEQQALQVAIAEAVNAELSPADGAEEGEVWLGPGAQGTDAFAFVSGRFADIAYQFTQRSGGIRPSQGIQIALVGGLTDLSAPVGVGNAAAQRAPAGLSVGIAFLGPEYLEVAGVIHRG